MLIVGYRVSRIYEQLEQPRFCKLAMNMMFDNLTSFLKILYPTDAPFLKV